MLSGYDLFWWLGHEKNRVLLSAFWDKISIFYFWPNGPWRAVMVHSARRIALLFSFIWCRATKWTRSTELNRLNDRDFPLHALSFARSVPGAQVAFSSEPSCNLLCATILDIISTSCAYVLSLRRVRSPPPHAARDSARAAVGPSTFWWRASPMGLSSRGLLLLLASHLMALTRERNNPSRIAQEIEMVTLVPYWSRSITRGSSFPPLWSWWSIYIYGRNKFAVSLWNVIFEPCSETAPKLRTSLFVDRWL